MREREALLRLEMSNVGKAAVFLNLEDAAAIAAQSEQPIRLGGERVDNLIFAGPDFARRLTFGEGVDVSAFRDGGTSVGRLERLRLDDSDGDGGHSLHRQRRERVAALVADTGGIDRSVGCDGNGRDFAARRLEQNVALAAGIDAVDEARAVGAGDEVSLCIPGEIADVGFVALEEELRSSAGFGDVDTIDGGGIARGDVEAAGGIEG